jgi:SAM-dependent methyltransferase
MGRRKRSLSHTGGKVETSGDPSAAGILARCLRVDPAAKLPFTHGFHPYPARMHPETARLILEAFPGGAVLDCFCGSGTVALEAVRAGRAFTGIDVSAVALEVAWARTRVWHPDECRRFEREAIRVADDAFGESDRSEFRLPDWALRERDWYEPHTLREVGVLREQIDRAEPSLCRLMRVVLSSLLVKLSKQRTDSDPKPDLFHRPRPRGATFRAFKDRVDEVTRGLLQLSSDLYKRKVALVEPDLRVGDARKLALKEGGHALVVSSPPYCGVYDYTRQHARRYALLGIDPSAAELGEIGSRRTRGAKYAEDLRTVLQRILAALAPSGRALLLVGDGEESGQAFDGAALLADLAGKAGARVIATASQKRRSDSEGPPRREHLVMLGRSASVEGVKRGEGSNDVVQGAHGDQDAE